jgi:hypothetical protein
MGTKPKLKRGDYHEMTDRLHVISCMVNDHLIQHQVSKLDEEVNEPIEQALELLFEAYQISAGKLFGVYE